jgi:subtilisin family serine protease
MRGPHALRVALLCALVAAFITSHSFAAESVRLVVGLEPGSANRSEPTLPPTRLATLHLTSVGTLADRLPPWVLETRRDLSPVEAALERAFGLDPTRVLLAAAKGSSDAAAALAHLLQEPGVEWAELDLPREATALPLGFPNEPMFADGRQWPLRNLGAASPWGGLPGADVSALDAWQWSVGSNELLLAIADTGIDPAHPELVATLPDGRPRIVHGINLADGAGGSFADSVGHGMPVAAVMAARTGEGAHLDSLGMAGVCGGDGRANAGCRLVPIKISSGHANTALSSTIANAILYASALGARAMNLSFTGGGPSTLERRALYHAITRGTVVVTSIGNDGNSAPRYPAAYAYDGLAIAVGSTDAWDRRSLWSSYGPGLDLLAPGENVWTAWTTYPTANGTTYPGYLQISGTSLAAPHVTGAVGLLAATKPALSDVDFQHVLRESADDLAAPGPDAETGCGRLNLARALTLADSGLGVWHDEVAATEFRSDGFDTLIVTAPDAVDLVRLRGRVYAERFEVRATVAIPDSFVDSVRVWPRVGGTSTVRGDYRLPYLAPHAEVLAQGPRHFVLRGYLYRAWPPDGDDPIDFPVELDLARFGFTVLGRVDRTPRVAAPSNGPAPSTIVATPNPFRAELTLALPRAGTLTILDVSGRVVRRAAVRGTMPRFVWDGRDLLGRRCRSGLYFVRLETAAGILHTRVVLLE